MFITESISSVAFFLVSGICAVTDLTSRRIHNTVLLMGAASILTSYCYCPPCVKSGELLPLLLFEGLLVFLFLFHLIGGGDVKLYALMIMAFPGAAGLMIVAGSIFLAGIYALILMLHRGILKERLQSTLQTGKYLFQGTLLLTDGVLFRGTMQDRIEIPMAVFVFSAALPVMLGTL